MGRLNLKDKPSTGVSRYLVDTSLVNNSSGSLEVLAKQEMQTGFKLHKDQNTTSIQTQCGAIMI